MRKSYHGHLIIYFISFTLLLLLSQNVQNVFCKVDLFVTCLSVTKKFYLNRFDFYLKKIQK